MFDAVYKEIAQESQRTGRSLEDSDYKDVPYLGNVYMGHLRYSTTGRSGLNYTHPFMRRNNWSSRNMLLCGNFNMTNVDEIFDSIVSTGQHPRLYADTFLLLEQLGHALDRRMSVCMRFIRIPDYRILNLRRVLPEILTYRRYSDVVLRCGTAAM